MPTTEVTSDAPNPILAEFWVRDAQAIEDDLAALRSAPPVFLAEEESQIPDIIPTGPGGWVITRHADILEASKNPQVFSSAEGITMLDTPMEFAEFFSSMIVMDDPRHARLRKLVSAGFTPRKLNQLIEGVQVQAAQIVDNVIDQGECDFVVDLAARLPLKIVCDLMGIPESEIDTVFDHTNVILGAGDPEYVADVDDAMGAILNAGLGLSGLMTEIAEKKDADSTGATEDDDLTTILVNAEVDGEKLSYADIASFFILLVVAGNETTRNSMAWGLHHLTQNPEQKAIWQADLDGVGPTAVEEIVRIASPVTYMRRTTLEDTHLGGTDIPAGDKVALFYIAANRDEDVFENPYAFDVKRNPNPHVGFGGPGPHFCLGAHLARRQIQVMYSEIFNRMPNIRATSEPDLLSSSFIHGIKHLTARWD